MYHKLCESNVLESDVAWCGRHPDAGDHTYAFLRRRVERPIDNDRGDMNFLSRRNAFERKSSPPELQPGASAPEAKPKSKAEAKAKPNAKAKHQPDRQRVVR
jgi:hypothetical protein